MNKTSKLFLVMVCIGLIPACSTTRWVKSKNINVEWNAPTYLLDGTPITKDMELKYHVYIYRDTDNTHDGKELLTQTPISETSYTIDSIEHKGKYFIGIQAISYRDEDGKLYDDPKESRIAWPSNKSDTESGSFGIDVE